MKKAWLHFKTITKHRHKVIQHCFKAGIPLQGLLHDISKYSPAEFFVGAKHYKGNRSPNEGERESTVIRPPGCTTKGATSIIMNTGRIIALKPA